MMKQRNLIKKLPKSRLPKGCLGYKDDLTEREMYGGTICGVSGLVFIDSASYLNHKSPVTGYKPTQPEHLGERFILQSKKALQRGKSLTPEKELELDRQREEAKSTDVDRKLKIASGSMVE